MPEAEEEGEDMSATRPEQLSCPACHAINQRGLRKKVRVKKGRLQCADCGYNELLQQLKSNTNSKQLKVGQEWVKNGSSCGSSSAHIIVYNYNLSDKRVKKILGQIKLGKHERAISKRTKIPLGTTQRIIKFLEKSKIIEPKDKNDSEMWIKTYKLIDKVGQVVVGDEERKAEACCRSHHQKWKFELNHEAENLKQAMSISCINTTHLQNNKFKDFFRSSGNTVRLTSKHVVIFVKKNLQTDDIDNLNAKYIQLAKDEARQFCTEHNITVNPTPTKYQGNDFDILSADPLAQMMLERGNFDVHADGLNYRVDPSDKGIEAKEDDAKEILFRLHGMRPLIEALQVEVKEIKETVVEVKNRQKASCEVTNMEKELAELRKELQNIKVMQVPTTNIPTDIMYG